MFKKTLLTTTALSVLVSSIAVAEIKVSGKQEWEFGQLSKTGSSITDSPKTTASETVIAVTGGGDLGGGNSYAVAYEFANGDQDVVQANLNFGAFDIEIGNNGSAGIEDIKALLPFVNNRIQDIGGTSFGNNLTDNSSGQTYFAANMKAGDMGAVSIAYNPNEANTGLASDGARGTVSTGSSISGSFKGSLGVEGLTFGIGILKGSNAATANDDKAAESVGVTYNAGSFAIGYQRMKQTANAAKSATVENTIDLYGVSYKVADNLSVGVYKIDDTKSVEGSTDVELSSTLVSVGYNLGAAKVSYDYIDADNYAHSAGKGATLHRVKIGMAF